jgi:micrococcal nuclease
MAKTNTRLHQVIGKQLPLPGFDLPLPGDPDPVLRPAYRYKAWVVGIYDSDTLIIHIDMGFHFVWQFRKIRLAGLNAYEITKKRGVADLEKKLGFDGRDAMISWLGLDPETFPRKSKYFTLPEPIEIVVETVKDESGKFGRILVVMWREGSNLNQWLARAGFAEVTYYDGEYYPPETPIFPHPPKKETP